MYAVAAHERPDGFDNLQVAERGELIEHEENARLVGLPFPHAGVERRGQQEAQPARMTHHHLRRQNEIDRNRPLFHFPEINAATADVVGDFVIVEKFGLALGTRRDGLNLFVPVGELTRFVFQSAQSRSRSFRGPVWGFPRLADASLSALCWPRREATARGRALEPSFRPRLADNIHDERGDERARRVIPMRVFLVFGFNEGFGQERRIGIERGRERIERRERIEALALEMFKTAPVGENAEGIDDDHFADRLAMFCGDGGQLPLGVDDEEGTVFQLQQVRNQQAGPFSRTVRTEDQHMAFPRITHPGAYAVSREDAPQNDRVWRV